MGQVKLTPKRVGKTIIWFVGKFSAKRMQEAFWKARDEHPDGGCFTCRLVRDENGHLNGVSLEAMADGWSMEYGIKTPEEVAQAKAKRALKATRKVSEDRKWACPKCGTIDDLDVMVDEADSALYKCVVCGSPVEEIEFPEDVGKEEEETGVENGKEDEVDSDGGEPGNCPGLQGCPATGSNGN